MVENGEEVKKVRDKLDVIILGVEPEAGRMIKTFYSKGYTSGAKEPPSCASDDGIAPSSWVNDKQSPTCHTCPKNVFGSATSPSGKPTKACRDSKRAWVVLADDPKPIAERTLYGINITVASLKAFSEHGRKLASFGQGPSVCITTLVMLDMEYPQLEFQLTSWLNAEQVPQTLKLSTDKPWKMKFGNVGLALSMGETAKAGLPTSLPALPAHLQTGNVTDVESKPVITNDKIDDAIGKW